MWLAAGQTHVTRSVGKVFPTPLGVAGSLPPTDDCLRQLGIKFLPGVAATGAQGSAADAASAPADSVKEEAADEEEVAEDGLIET